MLLASFRRFLGSQMPAWSEMSLFIVSWDLKAGGRCSAWLKLFSSNPQANTPAVFWVSVRADGSLAHTLQNRLPPAVDTSRMPADAARRSGTPRADLIAASRVSAVWCGVLWVFPMSDVVDFFQERDQVAHQFLQRWQTSSQAGWGTGHTCEEESQMLFGVSIWRKHFLVGIHHRPCSMCCHHRQLVEPGGVEV